MSPCLQAFLQDSMPFIKCCSSPLECWSQMTVHGWAECLPFCKPANKNVMESIHCLEMMWKGIWVWNQVFGPNVKRRRWSFRCEFSPKLWLKLYLQLSGSVFTFSQVKQQLEFEKWPALKVSLVLPLKGGLEADNLETLISTYGSHLENQTKFKPGLKLKVVSYNDMTLKRMGETGWQLNKVFIYLFIFFNG